MIIRGVEVASVTPGVTSHLMIVGITGAEALALISDAGGEPLGLMVTSEAMRNTGLSSVDGVLIVGAPTPDSLATRIAELAETTG